MNWVTLRSSLFLMISLLMAQSAWAEAYRHSATGIVFPDRIATLEKRAEATDYETKSPGLGVSVAYDGPGITVTVYVYTMNMKFIPTGLNSLVLRDNFSQAVWDIERMGELGRYSDVKRISDGEVSWDASGKGVTSHHAFYSYWQNGRDRLSHLYLMGFRNHFFKIRFTYDEDRQKYAERIRSEMLLEFSRILSCLEN